MLKINSSGRFKKDLKLCQKRGYDLQLLEAVIDILRIPDQLPIQNKDHFLKGDYSGRRECHIAPDWLLIYEIYEDVLYLERTGTHSDLFR
ncbi:MAG: type II toxin-antitoxin system YafQ family toxin [Lachnospiraceae bacterium]|nr:type II toxin-antitoxin system YafQ family toxin [Lachnospiraceae bacterium]